MIDKRKFVDALRQALMQLDDLQSLRKSPLLPLVAKGKQGANPIALQQSLLEAVEALKLGSGVGHARYYDVLYYRYLEQLNQPDVAFQLGVSVRQLRREQTNAIEYLADRLWEHFGLGSDLASAGVPEGTLSAQVAAQVASLPQEDGLAQEIAWLHHEVTAEPCLVTTLLAKALADVEVMRARYQVTWDVGAVRADLRIPAPLFVVQQALLTVLTHLLPRTAKCTVRIQVIEAADEVVLAVTPVEPEAYRAAEGVWERVLPRAAQLLSPFQGRVLVDLPSVQLIVPMVESVPVLVIDDNPGARQLFQRYAANSRFRVIATGEAGQAIALAERQQVRAAVIDVMMPEMDGWDLLSQWRHHPATQGIPVALCTILAQEELAQLLGARLFIQKPVDQVTFLQALALLTA